MINNEFSLLENFQKIGFWELDEKYKSHKVLSNLNLKGINFNINKKYSNLKNVIYLFRTDSEILYIGETTRGMQSRFESYRYGFDKINDTDNRVKIGLTEILELGKRIEILYFEPITEYKLGKEELIIPLSKPIEEYLISKLHPKFNEKGKLEIKTSD